MLICQGQGPYAAQLKKVESDIKEIQKRVNEKLGKSCHRLLDSACLP